MQKNPNQPTKINRKNHGNGFTLQHSLYCCAYFVPLFQLHHADDSFLVLTTDGINFMVNSQEICDFINQCHDPAEAAHVVTEQVMPGFLEAPKLCCKGNAADSWHRLCRCSVCSVGSFSAHGKDKSRKLSYEEMVVYSWCTCLFFFLFVFQRKKKKHNHAFSSELNYSGLRSQ